MLAQTLSEQWREEARNERTGKNPETFTEVPEETPSVPEQELTEAQEEVPSASEHLETPESIFEGIPNTPIYEIPQMFEYPPRSRRSPAPSKESKETEETEEPSDSENPEEPETMAHQNSPNEKTRILRWKPGQLPVLLGIRPPLPHSK